MATAYSNETSVTSKPLSPGGVYDVRVTEVISVSQKESLQSTPIRLHVRSRIPGSPPSNWRSVEGGCGEPSPFHHPLQYPVRATCALAPHLLAYMRPSSPRSTRASDCASSAVKPSQSLGLWG